MGDKTVLITGCSSGIGLCVARGLKQRGWRVFATARQTTDVMRLQAEGLESLRLVLPWLANLHVYQWTTGARLPLQDGADAWRALLPVVRDHAVAMSGRGELEILRGGQRVTDEPTRGVLRYRLAPGGTDGA